MPAAWVDALACYSASIQELRIIACDSLGIEVPDLPYASTTPQRHSRKTNSPTVAGFVPKKPAPVRGFFLSQVLLSQMRTGMGSRELRECAPQSTCV